MLRYDRGTLLYTVLLYSRGMVKLMCYGMIEVLSDTPCCGILGLKC